jgi:hypothetical protein
MKYIHLAGLFVILFFQQSIATGQTCDSSLMQLKEGAYEKILDSDYLINADKKDSICFLAITTAPSKRKAYMRLYDASGKERLIEQSAFSGLTQQFPVSTLIFCTQPEKKVRLF